MTVSARRRILAALVPVLIVGSLLAACAGSAETPPAAAFTPAPVTTDGTGTASASEIPASPVAGIILKVDSTGLDQVHGFTLQAESGEELTFVLGTLDNATEFPPGHLKEHQASADPVLVFFREENGKLVVYHIEDAG